MSANLIETLNNRRFELHKELAHIEGLIKFYQGSDRVAKVEKPVKQKPAKVKRAKRKVDVKSQMLTIIRQLDGEFYIGDLINALQILEPDKPRSAISTKARNYVYMFRKEGLITARRAENNKFIYKLVTE